MTRPELREGHASVYVLHGLSLRSPVPIVGFPQEGGTHDVDVVWTEAGPVPGVAPIGRLVAARSAGGTYLYVAADDGTAWTLRVPGLSDFLIDRGRRVVECRVDPSADLRLVALLVAGLVVAFLLSLGGDCVLHASAVEVDGAAIAFAGPSGSGKSTLAALLCGQGALVVSDDLLRLEAGPPPACVGGSPQLRLRRGAAWALDGFAAPPASTSTVDERLGVTPASGRGASVPLALIVLPRLSASAEGIEVRRVRGAASVAELAAVTRVGGWRDPSVVRAQFQTLSTVAAHVPVVEMVLPPDRAWRPVIGPTVLDSFRRVR